MWVLIVVTGVVIDQANRQEKINKKMDILYTIISTL